MICSFNCFLTQCDQEKPFLTPTAQLDVSKKQAAEAKAKCKGKGKAKKGQKEAKAGAKDEGKKVERNEAKDRLRAKGMVKAGLQAKVKEDSAKSRKESKDEVLERGNNNKRKLTPTQERFEIEQPFKKTRIVPYWTKGDVGLFDRELKKQARQM
jgi:hypothetical protein